MKPISRRRVVAAISAAGAGTCVCGLSGGCASVSKVGKTVPIATDAYVIEATKVVVDLSQVAALNEVGGSAKIIDARLPTPLIIARTDKTEYAVVSLLCPHRGVEVEYRHQDKQFRCASLGHSRFGTDGAFNKGPAAKPLNAYAATLDPADRTSLVITL